MNETDGERENEDVLEGEMGLDGSSCALLYTSGGVARHMGRSETEQARDKTGRHTRLHPAAPHVLEQL